MVSTSDANYLHAKVSTYQKVHFITKVAAWLLKKKTTFFFWTKDLTYNIICVQDLSCSGALRHHWPRPWRWFSEINAHLLPSCFSPAGCIARTVSSPNQHLLRTDDVISCCLDLSAPSISFRINGQPVQGMFENFNIDGLFFPVVSFSAGIKLVFLYFLCFWSVPLPTDALTGGCMAVTPASLTFSPSLLGACPVLKRGGKSHPRGQSGGLDAVASCPTT